ncbi:uncharacterized protein K444DRAFT_633023 [Hyaloscypha bicolor E]|uniref:Uncharacterized protein n=1 Tax=Hyaloscypha bicolor E TaxID=1095630 RepID=A0A2J6T0U5_9HELO|nr:uncharacterized protein K444DRAFT_633023 [Hyaloscypha bicolor E]PMD56634.1 hypothetical protein K444DRAFT_633023 [Hyaloscypha bicolor E]
MQVVLATSPFANQQTQQRLMVIWPKRAIKVLANSRVSGCFEGIAIRQDDVLSIVSRTMGQSSHPECASCSMARSVVGNGGRRDFHVHAGKRRKTSLEESVSPTTLWSENFPNMEKTTSMRLWKKRAGQLKHSCRRILLGQRLPSKRKTQSALRRQAT